MKKVHWLILILGIVLFVGVCVSFAGSAQSHSVGTNSVKILPQRPVLNAPAWATNTLYAQGDVVLHSNMFFWCQVAGGGTNTASDVPAYEADGRSSDGTNTWEFIPRNTKRKVGVIGNDSSYPIYVSTDAIVVGSGVRLNANGGTWNIQDDILQSAFYAISTNASAAMATFDR